MGISSLSVFSPMLEQENGFELVSLEHTQQRYLPRSLQVTADTISIREQETWCWAGGESLRRLRTPSDARVSGFTRGLDGQRKNSISAEQSNLLQTSHSEMPPLWGSKYPEQPHCSVAYKNDEKDKKINTADARIVLGDDVSGLDTLRSCQTNAQSYSGKNRAIDLSQDSIQIGLEQFHDTTPSTVSDHQSEPDGDRHQGSSILGDNVNTWPSNDLQFERNQYLEKKAERIRRNALGMCIAIVTERCRVHGKALQYASSITLRNSTPKSTGNMASPVWRDETSDLGDSETLCGTMLEDVDLVEEAGLAAEKRQRDDNSLICVEGWMGIVILALGVAAIVMFAVDSA